MDLKAYAAVFAAVIFLLCAPIWLVRHVPLMDYPNHLARMYILHHLNEAPEFATQYDISLNPIPNLAMDLVVPVLLSVVSLQTAGKIFLTLTVLVFCLGCHIFGRTLHGRATWLAPLCAFLSYNMMFLTGFVNYVFGVGMFLIAFAAWLRFHPHWTVWRFLLVTVLFFASYLAHLSAYSFLGFSCVVVCAADVLAARRIRLATIVSLVPLVPPVIAFKAFMSSGGTVGKIVWSTVLDKLKDFSVLFRTYDHLFDLLFAIALTTVVAIVLSRCKVVWKDARVFAAGCFLVFLYLAFPKTLFTSWGTDIRFLPPAALLIGLSGQLMLRRSVARTAFFLVCVILLVRMGAIYQAWNEMDPRIETQLRLIEKLEPGARVYPITLYEDPYSRGRAVKRTLRHTIHYATIERHTYVPSLFAIASQQPLRFKVPPKSRGIEVYEPPSGVKWDEVFANYDYVWGSNLTPNYFRFLNEKCELVAATADDQLFRIRKSTGASAAARVAESPKQGLERRGQ